MSALCGTSGFSIRRRTGPRRRCLGSIEAYPGLDDKAAVLLESVVRNHALVDGNKRLGWLAVVVFYGLNDVVLEAPDDDAYALVIAMAEGAIDHRKAAARLATWRG